MKSVIAVLVALLGALGAFTLKVEWTAGEKQALVAGQIEGQTQARLAHLAITMSKACDK
jgi:hypothetical protein